MIEQLSYRQKIDLVNNLVNKDYDEREMCFVIFGTWRYELEEEFQNNQDNEHSFLDGLTERDRQILRILSKARGKIVPYQDMYRFIFGEHAQIDDNLKKLFTVSLSHLRKKITASGLEKRIIINTYFQIGLSISFF